ncbi:hypothetical protein MYX82_02385, partial [Acidobacteria bacterium AH-259-D05]|nr:hypothetical protein [Acidobacteria bacterium AH-259-D05]
TMSKDRGSTLPQDLSDFLSRSGHADQFKEVILFNTVDEDGWPRHGLLSPREIVAKDNKRLLMLLYSNSRSTRNLQREGKVSLIVVNPDMSYYLFCSARSLPPLPEAATETLFELTVERVLDDSMPTAKILTGITFEGYDPGMTEDNRVKVFQRLMEMG